MAVGVVEVGSEVASEGPAIEDCSEDIADWISEGFEGVKDVESNTG